MQPSEASAAKEEKMAEKCKNCEEPIVKYRDGWAHSDDLGNPLYEICRLKMPCAEPAPAPSTPAPAKERYTCPTCREEYAVGVQCDLCPAQPSTAESAEQKARELMTKLDAIQLTSQQCEEIHYFDQLKCLVDAERLKVTTEFLSAYTLHLQQQVEQLCGCKFSDRNYHALKSRAEAAEQTNRTLREALRDLVISADANWYHNAGGHDWVEAMDNARALLTPPPTQKGENDGQR